MHREGDAAILVVFKPRINREKFSVFIIRDNYRALAMSPIENKIVRTIAAGNLNELVFKLSTQRTVLNSIIISIGIPEFVFRISVEKARI